MEDTGTIISLNLITFVGFKPAIASSKRTNREIGVNPVRSRHCNWELLEDQK